MRVIRDVIGIGVGVWCLLPEQTRQTLIQAAYDKTLGRAELAAANEVAACANYLEEAANQFERGGSKDVAEAIRVTIKGMVAARTSGLDTRDFGRTSSPGGDDAGHDPNV